MHCLHDLDQIGCSCWRVAPNDAKAPTKEDCNPNDPEKMQQHFVSKQYVTAMIFDIILHCMITIALKSQLNDIPSENATKPYKINIRFPYIMKRCDKLHPQIKISTQQARISYIDTVCP